MRWGLIPSRANNEQMGPKTINAPVGVVQTKPAFRTAFRRRRCLVPASGYFEWKGAAASRQPYFVCDPKGELLMFAGIWDAWKPITDERQVRTFAIVTGARSLLSGDVHDRQPILLPPNRWQPWLRGTPDEAGATLMGVPEIALAHYPVPKRVGSPQNQSRELVEPVSL
jgi:putative SOS response-associated peptidase YedK